MRHFRHTYRFAFTLTMILLAAASLHARQFGITNGFAYTPDPSDTVASPYLPSLPAGEAGAHGFLRGMPDGSFQFSDGTPARFFGVTLQATACFPDSVEAITVAAHLRKLGVNLVRFQYMDFSYDWAQEASFLDLATGFRSIHEGRMRRFDWFVQQLKRNGVYSYLLLQSARVPRPEDGMGANADSALFLGRGLYHLYPEARAAHKRIAQLLLDHVNPFTGTAYKNEPAVAMIEMLDAGSITSLWRINQDRYVAGQNGFSYRHSRRLDTLFAAFLKARYGSTAGLATAWTVTPPTGGFPNLITEGSFEGAYEQQWIINSDNGISLTQILSTDSVPDGKYALTLRVNSASGNVGSAVIAQTVPLKFNTLYRMSFKAKCSNAGGRMVRLVNATSNVEGALSAGLNTQVQITPYWKEQEAFFLVPVSSTLPMTVAMFFGDVNGELSIDDVQIREYVGAGLQPGETIENATVTRIPWGNNANYLVLSKRVEDQSDFYFGLDQNYFDDVRRYVADTLRNRQVLTGASSYWASGYMEARTQASMGFSAVQSGWDYTDNDANTGWHIRNYSPLRAGYGGSIYDVATFAHARQPIVAAFQQPYPNRYQSESMIFLPAFASFQGWDGLIWDMYADSRADYSSKAIDSIAFGKFAGNPVVTSLLPAASQILRTGLLSPAQTTIGIRHSQQQARLLPRMEVAWGRYAMPGGMPGFAMAADRIVIDSIDASFPTQSNDISFAPQLAGQVMSDTRQILWEYNRGVLSLNAPRVQCASGFLSTSGSVALDMLDVDVQSINETSTVLWIPLDSASMLASPGRSLLTLATRTEPTGWHWKDSTQSDRWGTAPMLIDPIRVRLTFTLPTNIASVTITPLDVKGMPTGMPIQATKSGKSFAATIDQKTTPSVWYSVETSTSGSSVKDDVTIGTTSIAILSGQASDVLRIRLTLAQPSHDARVELFDALGRFISTIRNGSAERGEQILSVNTRGLSSGMYFVRLRTEEGRSVSARVNILR